MFAVAKNIYFSQTGKNFFFPYFPELKSVFYNLQFALTIFCSVINFCMFLDTGCYTYKSLRSNSFMTGGTSLFIGSFKCSGSSGCSTINRSLQSVNNGIMPSSLPLLSSTLLSLPASPLTPSQLSSLLFVALTYS